MEFDIFDSETRSTLRSAGVEVPRKPLPSLSEDEIDESVANHPELLAGPPADPRAMTAAFGHWAEDAGGARESAEPPSPSEAAVDAKPAHPPIDVRGWTEQEIRDFYQQKMEEDWAHAETYNEQMNQDLQDRLAYEATGAHDTWHRVKEIGLGIGAGVGLAGLAEGLAVASPIAAWFLGMSQAETEGEAGFGAMFFPFGGGAWSPRAGAAREAGAERGGAAASATSATTTSARTARTTTRGTDEAARSVGPANAEATAVSSSSDRTSAATQVETSPAAEAVEAARGTTKTDRLKKHVLNGELDAARREAGGEVVARKPDGTPWDHVTELRDAQRGLLKRIRKIKKQLGGDLTDEARATLQQELSEASRLLDKTEEYLPR